MNYVYFVVIPVLVSVIIIYAFMQGNKIKKDADLSNFIVYQPKLFLWIGVICMLFFSALLVLVLVFPNETAEWWVYLAFFAFFLLGVYLTLFCASWKLIVSDAEITHKALFKSPRTFAFTAITMVKMRQLGKEYFGKVHLYSDAKKIVTVEPQCIGYRMLIERLKKEQIKFEAAKGLLQ